MFENEGEIAYRAYRVVPDEPDFPREQIVGQDLIGSQRFFVKETPSNKVATAVRLREQLVARELAPGDYVFYPEAEVIEISVTQTGRVTRAGTWTPDHDSTKPASGLADATLQQLTDESLEELHRITDRAAHELQSAVDIVRGCQLPEAA